ncbi:hypothetical protein STEG23_026657, partial [Scotinomys teguina]
FTSGNKEKNQRLNFLHLGFMASLLKEQLMSAGWMHYDQLPQMMRYDQLPQMMRYDQLPQMMRYDKLPRAPGAVICLPGWTQPKLWHNRKAWQSSGCVSFPSVLLDERICDSIKKDKTHSAAGLDDLYAFPHHPISTIYDRFPHYDPDALVQKNPSSRSLTGLLELCLVFDCGSLHLLPSVIGEKLCDDS